MKCAALAQLCVSPKNADQNVSRIDTDPPRQNLEG